MTILCCQHYLSDIVILITINEEVKITLEIKKSLIAAIKPGVRLDASGLLGHSKEMNQRIEKNIADNEKKIEMGMKKAQGIQM